jgi:hypothetical protein
VYIDMVYLSSSKAAANKKNFGGITQ